MKRAAYKAGFLAAFALGLAQFATPAMAQVNGVTATEIIIGSHTSLSGPAAEHGNASVTALRMRFEEINSAGGIHGRKIRFIVEDNQYEVPRAVQAANKLINRDKVFLMVQNMGTPMNNAVLPEQLKANIPNMFPGTLARQMVEPFHRLKFLGVSSYYDMQRAEVRWLVKNKGKKRVCTMYFDNDYGRENLDGVRDELQKLGLPLIEHATHKPADTDFSPQLIKLRNANCDLVMIGGLVRDAILIVTSARNMGWTDVDFGGVQSSYDPAVAAAPGATTEGFYAVTSMPVPNRATASPAAVKWIDAYKARAGVEPNTTAALGLVYADLVAIGLERAGKDLTVDKFIAGIESIKDYRDIFGGPTQSYGPNKHQGATENFLLQVRGGKWVPVAGPIGYEK